MTGRAHAELIEDLARALPLEQEPARSLGIPATATPAVAPYAAARDALIRDVAATAPADRGLAGILRVHSSPTGLLADLTPAVDVARGLNAILVGGGTPSGTRPVVAAPDLEDSLAAIRLSPDDQRLLLRDGPTWLAVRKARRSLDEISSVLARTAAVDGSRSGPVDVLPEILMHQHNRVARAAAGLASALGTSRTIAGMERWAVRLSRTTRITVVDIEGDAGRVRTDPDIAADGHPAAPGEAQESADNLDALQQELFSLLRDEDTEVQQALSETLMRMDHAKARRLLEVVRESPAAAGDYIARITDNPHVKVNTESPGTPTNTQAPHGVGPDAVAEDTTAKADPPPRNRKGSATYSGAGFGAVDLKMVPHATMAQGRAGTPDRDVMRGVTALAWEVVDDLADLAEQLERQPPAAAGDRLLRRCRVLLLELDQVLAKVWAALSDFRGADLRDGVGVSREDLDGVRWSDGSAEAGVTEWPDTVRDWVTTYSTPVNEAPGEFEVRFGAAVPSAS